MREREREAAKKTKLSSFRFFFDRTFAKKEEEESETTSFRFSRRRGQKRKEKKFSLSPSLLRDTHAHTQRDNIYLLYIVY
jgi:hypothetical protein